MSTASQPAHSQPEPSGIRLRQLLLGTLFALVLLVPKILHLRRNPRSWMLFRVFLGIVGAALVILPLGWSNSYLLSLVGLILFTSSVLLPPAKPEISVDDKARELAALVVVNGGSYAPGGAGPSAVQLFVGTERIYALDARFQPLLVIPVNEITLARAEQSSARWVLRIVWAGHSAEFCYRGVFAEHLARVAESTLQRVMRQALPVIQQSHAAGA